MQRSNRHLLLLALLASAGCGGNPTPELSAELPLATPTPVAGMAYARDGGYSVTIIRQPQPIPVGKMQSWTLHVRNERGRGVRDAEFTLHLSPASNGQSPTRQPKIRQHLGGGRYKLEGLQFPHPGEWRMEINILRGSKQETVVFDAISVGSPQLPLANAG